MTVRICIDKELPPDQAMAAARNAIDENPDNLPSRRMRAPMGVAASPFRMALVTGKKWMPGRTLRVAFMGGEQRVKNRITEHVVRWRDSANIDFAFGSDPEAEIRVAFADDGSWSYLGTDALTIPRSRPTMNYGWLTPDLDDQDYQSVVCHEFGHALAAIHEHEHPDAGIPWDKEAVYEEYRRTQGWSREEVDQQVFTRYDRSLTQYGKYDRESIMHYPIDEALTVGDYAVGWNWEISPADAAFMRVAYPKKAKPPASLEIGAPPFQADIGAHGEVDAYDVRVAKRARLRFETTGAADLVMTLAGPDDPKRLIADDDDTGPGANPCITRTLHPGQYTLRVRHYRPSGIGKYGISIVSA